MTNKTKFERYLFNTNITQQRAIIDAAKKQNDVDVSKIISLIYGMGDDIELTPEESRFVTEQIKLLTHDSAKFNDGEFSIIYNSAPVNFYNLTPIGRKRWQLGTYMSAAQIAGLVKTETLVLEQDYNADGFSFLQREADEKQTDEALKNILEDTFCFDYIKIALIKRTGTKIVNGGSYLKTEGAVFKILDGVPVVAACTRMGTSYATKTILPVVIIVCGEDEISPLSPIIQDDIYKRSPGAGRNFASAEIGAAIYRELLPCVDTKSFRGDKPFLTESDPKDGSGIFNAYNFVYFVQKIYASKIQENNVPNVAGWLNEFFGIISGMYSAWAENNGVLDGKQWITGGYGAYGLLALSEHLLFDGRRRELLEKTLGNITAEKWSKVIKKDPGLPADAVSGRWDSAANFFKGECEYVR